MVQEPLGPFTVELLLTHPQLFGLTTASPLQRALCRVAQGLPLAELANDPDIVDALGGPDAIRALTENGWGQPKELIVLSGIRTGKSLFTAALAVYASQTCDFDSSPPLGPGEIPRVTVLSVKKDSAKVVLNHIIGRLQASPILSGLIEGEPSAEGVFLKHPSGRLVEICVVPIDRAGGSVVSRWSAGCIFDEGPRLQSEDDGVENYDHSRQAVLERLRPGAFLITVGSPWAPRGSIYNKVREFWGKPSEGLVVVKAPGPAMNKLWWTPKRVAQAKKNDPTVYRTDCLAEFADPEANLFVADLIEKCTRKGPYAPLPYKAVNEYSAAMDPATRGNSWPLIITTQEDQVKKVVFIEQWTGSRATPLNPDAVLKQIAQHCILGYKVDVVSTDQFGGDTMAALARRNGLTLQEVWINKEIRYAMFDKLYRMMLDGKIELPDHPQLRTDLLGVRKRVTNAGVDIVLPKTGDGRHCDMAFALALAVWRYLDDPVILGPKPGTKEYQDLQVAEERAKVLNGRKNDDGSETAWWERSP